MMSSIWTPAMKTSKFIIISWAMKSRRQKSDTACFQIKREDHKVSTLRCFQHGRTSIRLQTNIKEWIRTTNRCKRARCIFHRSKPLKIFILCTWTSRWGPLNMVATTSAAGRHSPAIWIIACRVAPGTATESMLIPRSFRRVLVCRVSKELRESMRIAIWRSRWDSLLPTWLRGNLEEHVSSQR